MTGKDLKNSILQLAIQGKLVEQDANDEPARSLLKRIRKEKEQLVKDGKLKKKDLVTMPISDEEKPFEIPESWEWCRISDVGVTNTGTTPSKTIPEYFGSYIPFLGPGDIQNGVINYSNNGLSEKGKDAARPVCKDTILQVCIGGTIGKCAFVDREVTFNQQINSVTAIQVYFKYLYYCMVSDFFVKKMIDNSTGTATPIINRGSWDLLPIPLPPLAEQQRIVAKIEELMPLVDEYDKAQTQLDELNAKLPEALKKSILQEAIMGKLVPQDPNDEPASELLKRIRKEKEQLVKDGKLKKKDLVTMPISDEEKPFEIPESWEWCRLGEISTYACTKKKINASNANSEVWGLDLEDIEKGGRLLQKLTVGQRKAIGDKTIFSKNDILYSKLRPYLLKILVAPDDGICTPEIVPFRCYREINHPYIVSLLKSSYVDDYINSVTFGIKMPRVGTETMTNLLVPLPPLAEQRRIVAKLEEILPKISSLSQTK